MNNKAPKAKRAWNSNGGSRCVQRVVRAQMKLYNDGTASFHVRGYDFRFADLPIEVNGCLFAPMRPNNDSATPVVDPTES